MRKKRRGGAIPPYGFYYQLSKFEGREFTIRDLHDKCRDVEPGTIAKRLRRCAEMGIVHRPRRGIYVAARFDPAAVRARLVEEHAARARANKHKTGWVDDARATATARKSRERERMMSLLLRLPQPFSTGEAYEACRNGMPDTAPPRRDFPAILKVFVRYGWLKPSRGGGYEVTVRH